MSAGMSGAPGAAAVNVARTMVRSAAALFGASTRWVPSIAVVRTAARNT